MIRATANVTDSFCGSRIVGHVTWQGHTAGSGQSLPLTLTLKSGANEVNYPQQTTDASGFFTVTASLPASTYNWRTKGRNGVANTNPAGGPAYLANSGTLALPSSGTIQVEMGLQKAGDVNGDNVVGLSDFNSLKNTYGCSPSAPSTCDQRADYNGDGVVGLSDFNLLKNNYGALGAPPIRPEDGK